MKIVHEWLRLNFHEKRRGVRLYHTSQMGFFTAEKQHVAKIVHLTAHRLRCAPHRKFVRDGRLFRLPDYLKLQRCKNISKLFNAVNLGAL